MDPINVSHTCGIIIPDLPQLLGWLMSAKSAPLAVTPDFDNPSRTADARAYEGRPRGKKFGQEKKGEKPTYRWQTIRMTTLATRQFVAFVFILPPNLPRLSGSDLLPGV
ncbi:hypothetical protein HBI70_172190 [Parastagonospora nodorum]|nr:hypothetical protein HBH50_156670 [Parastagonospora nodorum]KAH4087534.1 hypothetical protein HBH48_133520 [Parastagonospora nodorum]KAH4604967.1 hypothetical protein HBH82_125980 [Parastagonospora nodorum]KAH4688293.1 hypothetical protein HBH78_102870 [Parastagonospora nodorum]KAH4706825.1 hypothetical protein HBH67_080850 [Parastagonospora nodorum]